MTTPANAAGMRWLAGLHPDPASCLDGWIAGRLVPVPIHAFAVLSVSAGLGLHALEILGHPHPPCPVLHSIHRGTVDFFVPTNAIQVPRRLGTRLCDGVLECPPPGRSTALPGRPPAAGRGAPGACWLVEPDGGGNLWPAAQVLRAVQRIYAAAARPPGSDVRLPTGTALRSLAPFFAAAHAAKATSTPGGW
ncbi:hypothetical protein GCM10025734_04440 [Kitasatospora paranensis]